MIEFLKKNWLQVALSILVLVAFGAGVAVGYNANSQPTKIVEKLVEKEVFRDKEIRVEVARELTTEELSKIRDEVRKETRRKETTVVIKPDGSSTKHEVETVGIDTTTKEAEIKIVEKIVEKQVVVEKEVVKFVDRIVEKTVETQRKQWILSGLAEVDVTKVGFQNGQLQFPIGGGAMVQFRPAGPFWLSLKGTHLGNVGFAAGLEF